MDRCKKHCTVVLVIAIFLVIGFVTPAGIFARGTAAPATSLVRTGTMTIEAKTDDAVISGERHFVVTDSTSIIDANGNPIQLADFPVPAKARIRYRLRMDQDPLCLKIEIKQ
ncbi:MAG: hypothetical protein JRI36_05805 [Deltaproteobacteria bacterium]|nr:hypothetical protein [Deltaproteobacteria bacterium]